MFSHSTVCQTLSIPNQQIMMSNKNPRQALSTEDEGFGQLWGRPDSSIKDVRKEGRGLVKCGQGRGKGPSGCLQLVLLYYFSMFADTLYG